MKGLIPQEIIDEINAGVDIVNIINQYVPLKKKGRNYQGLCPFHHEKTPSFTVSPDKKIFHCFGCGVGGNVFTFLMKVENLRFPEAVRKLAPLAGVSVPERDLSPFQKKNLQKKKRLIQINEMATEYYQKILLETKWGKVALDYLKKRGINLAIINKFQLGYALPSWDGLINFMTSRGVKIQELLELGFILPSREGKGYYDRFRGRLMFPIWDMNGRVVAFGARVLDQGQPKYLNSPDTPLFNKGQHLYGIHLAKNSIRREDLALVVEGYMDVLSCHQYGVTNAVASLGTAFTKEQAKILLRHSYQVAICYDADAAGSLATLRGLDILTDFGCQVRVINLPEGLDPDDFLQKKGKKELDKLVLKAKGLIEYKLDKSIEKGNPSTIQGKTKIVHSILPDLLKIDSYVAQQGAIELCSEKLGLTFETIVSELKRFTRAEKRGIINNKAKSEGKIFLKNLNKIEVQVLKIILENNFLFENVEEVGGEKLFTSPLKEIYQKTRDLFKTKGKVVGNELSDEDGIILSHIIMQNLIVEDVNKAILDYLKILKINWLDKEYDAKQRELKEAEKLDDIGKMRELLFYIDNILQQKRSLIP